MFAIKTLREKVGMTKTQLAAIVGVTPQAVIKWESGEAYPTADKLPTICQALQCQLDDLYQ